MLKKLIVILALVMIVVSCKQDSKRSKADEVSEISTSETAFEDRKIEEALFEGYFVKNPSGYDIALKNNTLYMLKANPSEKDKTTNFFVDVIPKNGSLQNFNLPPSDINLNDSLSKNYNNVAVHKFVLPKVEGEYEIIVGQYDNVGRVWTTTIQSGMLGQDIRNYRNEYAKNIKSTRYLKEFELALGQGYFMMYPEGYDVLVNGNIVYFIKPTNIDVDVDTRFYLHLKFENTEENMVLDFNGREAQIDQRLGSKYKNFTVIRKEVPSEKKIVEVGVGQFNNEGRTWQVVYDLEKMYDNITYIYDNQYKDYIQK
ncbi:hypothetical protein [Gelidibacter sp.]|uniref:hypothetical protein n=1 Tax=Gelidibacter sp. TaxID=2018083 RepID=UPI002CCBDF47|nr:hypothetical protein [Gelidibacter sp.]HUH28970.1 hypothetical protein [Gelidibacter sp.]